jgi:hypothetical protein
MSAEDQRSDFEVIRDTLLQMDPDTRVEVVAAMQAIRACPRPVAVRILANAAMRADLNLPLTRIVTGGC